MGAAEQRGAWPLTAFGEVAFHRGHAGLRQWGDGLASSFAGASDVRPRSEVDVGNKVNEQFSPMRRPVWTAMTSSARSRRPVQVYWSGAATRASISMGVRNSMTGRAVCFGGIART